LFVAKNSSGFEMNLKPAAKKRSISHTFRHVYHFILEAVNGDRTKASTIFHKYFAGELPEQLLFISRRYVQENQKPKSRDGGLRGPASE
jgi:hypothetical protein